MTSERLPGKALKDLCGRPVVNHLLDRVFASKYVARENVIVCTTPDPANDALVAAVLQTGAQVFRGNEDDIIDRFWGAAQHFGLEAFLQVDGDDPCSDTTYMDRAMSALLSDQSLGIVTVEGLPLGLATKAIRTSALQRAWEYHLTERNDTGFIYYFTKTGLCPQLVLKADVEHRHPTSRLTLDYEQDMEFFRALFARLYTPGKIFGAAEIVACLEAEPALVQINAKLNEEYWNRTRAKAELEYRAPDGSRKKIEV